MDAKTLQQFATVFHAIADPKRQQIIHSLRRNGEMSVTQIAQELGVAQPTASQHLRVLKESGAVVSHKSGQQVFYRLFSVRICDALTDFMRIFQEEIKREQ